MSLFNTSVEKIFASALKDVHSVLRVFGKVASAAETAAPTVEAMSGLIPGYGTGAVAIEQAAFSLLGKAATVASNLDGDLPATATATLTLDATELMQIQKLLVDAAPVLSMLGITLPGHAAPKA